MGARWGRGDRRTVGRNVEKSDPSMGRTKRAWTEELPVGIEKGEKLPVMLARA